MTPETQNTSPARRGRWQFTLRQLLIAVGIIAFLLGSYEWLLTVDVSEVPPGITSASHYCGFINPEVVYPGLTEKDIRVRNVARISGRFFGNGSHVSAALFYVDAGKVTRVNVISAGQSPNRVGALFGEYLQITFAIGDLDTRDGRVTGLGCVGETRGGGIGARFPHNVSAAAHTFSPGRVGRGVARVVYAEGADPPVITQGMRIESFAAQNPGRYLAVTMQLE